MTTQLKKATFTLPNTIIQELTEFAEELGTKKSHMVTEALNQYFDTLDLQLAKKRFKEVHEEKVETIPLEEIRSEMGL